jgi:LynF/TruF/PatF family peptide O-prenyltransferase
MIACDKKLASDNLRYINEHKRAFQAEGSIYPLELFENFVSQAEGWMLECSCKIERDKLSPIRFNVFRKQPTAEHYRAVREFFRQVAVRVGVRINCTLLDQFVRDNLDFSKIGEVGIGIDLRKELRESRLKLFFTFSDYPEKVGAAIALCQPPKEFWELRIDNNLVVGFDFFLDGRSAIEVYTTVSKDNLRRGEVRERLAKVLSPVALQLLDSCSLLIVGFSKNKPENILYYQPRDPDSFISQLRNDLARRCHAYYQGQPVIRTLVGLREKELLAGFIENVNLYYQMNKLCNLN